jgi:hypothetical protein
MAALGALLLSTPAWGQRGGRGGMPMGGGRGGFVSHGGGGFVHGPVYGGGGFYHGPIHGGAPSGWGWRRPYYGYPYRYRHPYYAGGYPYGWGYPSVYGYGSYYYPGWGIAVAVGDSYAYPEPTYPAYAAYAPTYPDYSNPYAQSTQTQQAEIDRLSREVDRLQEQQASRELPSAPPSKAQIHAETVLVFRDKHTEEIQNYAVVGNTLWVFTELRARKIPIANLDVLATTKANEDRGIDFRLPK